MSDMTALSPTRDDLLNASVEMLTQIRDRLDVLIAALPRLPANREALATIVMEVSQLGDTCWPVMETYCCTIDCEGNA